MGLIQMFIDAWKGISLGTSISRRDRTYGLCLMAAVISLVWWWALYIYMPGADARNPPTPTNWGPQGIFSIFILFPLGILRFFALLFGLVGALMLFHDEGDRLLGILALATGLHAVLWIFPPWWLSIGDNSINDIGKLVSNGSELLFVVVSFWFSLLWFAKGRKQIEAAEVRDYTPIASPSDEVSQPDEVSLSDEYKRRASAGPPDESLESAPDSDSGAASAQVETPDASSAPAEQAQWQTPMETPASVDKILSHFTGDWPTRSESGQGSLLEDALRRRASVPEPTESQEGVPASEPDTTSTPQYESPDAGSFHELEPQEPASPETVVPSPAPAEVETSPAPRDMRDLSEEDLEKEVAEDGMDSKALYALAGKYRANGQLDRALELYRRTVELDPSNPQAQDDLGAALEESRKQAEAEAAYRRAIANDPYSFSAHLHLARLLRALKRNQESDQEFIRAQENAVGDDERRAAEAESKA